MIIITIFISIITFMLVLNLVLHLTIKDLMSDNYDLTFKLEEAESFINDLINLNGDENEHDTF